MSILQMLMNAVKPQLCADLVASVRTSKADTDATVCHLSWLAMTTKCALVRSLLLMKKIMFFFFNFFEILTAHILDRFVN